MVAATVGLLAASNYTKRFNYQGSKPLKGALIS